MKCAASSFHRKKPLRKELDQDFQKLRLLLKDEKAKTDDKEIGQVLDDVRQKRRQLQSLMDEQFREVAKFLSVRQQAELVLFLKDFHKEIRSMLRPTSGPAGGPSSDRADGTSWAATVPSREGHRTVHAATDPGERHRTINAVHGAWHP